MSVHSITGRVTLDGRPAGGAEVLLFGAGARPPLLATGTTDSSGRFELHNEAEGPLAVLTRLTNDVVGVAARHVDNAGPLTIDLAGPARILTIDVGGASRPRSLTVGLEPSAPAEVPERLRPFINQRAPGVFASRFVTRQLAGVGLTLRVLPGVWRISGEFIDPNRPNIEQPDFLNYVVASARSEPDGAPLPGTETAGFAVDLNRDRKVRVMLREVPDAEL